MIWRRSFIGIILLMLSWATFARGGSLEMIENLSVSDGLAHSGVTCILEDQNGFIWVGTYDGLNKYDGYRFQVFKNSLDQSYFYSNRIRSLMLDMNGNIWIGTDEGVSIYFYEQERFENLYSYSQNTQNVSGPVIRKIIEYKEHDLIFCLSEDGKIIVFDDAYNFKSSLEPDILPGDRDIEFYDGVAIDKEHFLLSSSIGLIQFNYLNGEYFHVLSNRLRVGRSLMLANDSTILATTANGIQIIQLFEYEDNYVYRQLSHLLEEYSFVSSSTDINGNLWLGSQHSGVFRVDNIDSFISNEEHTITFYQEDNDILRISSIFSSPEYGSWVGTFNKGIFRFDLEDNPFHYYNTELAYENAIQSNHILSITEVDSDRVYLTAMHGGTALFNTFSEEFEALPFKAPGGYDLLSWQVFVDSYGYTWITFGGDLGLARVAPGETTPRKVSVAGLDHLSGMTARKIEEDRKGNLWLASIHGLYKIYLYPSGEIEKVEALNDHPSFKGKPLSMIRNIYVDPTFDYLWVGTSKDGLFRIDFTSSLSDVEVDQYIPDKRLPNSISSSFVSCIHRTGDDLWVGTEQGGICKVLNSNAEPTFHAFTEKDGLSNNVVKSILSDDSGNLWISTNLGLNKFDTKTFRFQKFGIRDGLPFEEFYYDAVRMESGLMVFSSLDGVLYFHPDQLADREVLPLVYLDAFSIYNDIVSPGDTINDRVLLSSQIDLLDEIELKHNEDVFSLDLIALHYSNPENHFLKYRLAPQNEQWILTPSSQHTITFNGLRPGEYHLEIMASNSMDEWTEIRSIRIKIRPPFWRTTLAFILYFFALALLLYIVFKVVLRIQGLNHKLEIEQLETDKVKEVNAAKLNFFSNISHEIKTPLALLNSPLRYLYERFSSENEVVSRLQIVNRQTRKISQLVSQVQDFQRAEANVLKMNATRFSFNLFLKEVVSEFDYLAESEKKILSCLDNENEIFVRADRNKMEIILNNLLNNAFKFTSEGDKITVEFRDENQDLHLSVSDTGRGISEKDLPYIFDRFYKAGNQNGDYSAGSGIGLAFAKRLVEMHYGFIEAESKESEGSRFTLRLPVITNNYNAEQEKLEEDIIEAEKHSEIQMLLIDNAETVSISIAEEYRGAHIFLAEDNADMRDYMKDFLSDFFEVSIYSNGKLCLEALEDEWPQLVISDVLMPELNGFDLCKQIKSDIRTSHIPIILVTACNTKDDQIKGITDGADAYLHKPFDPQHLFATIEGLLKNRRQLAERFQSNIPLSLEKGKMNRNDRTFLEKLYALMEENLDNSNLNLDIFARELYLNRTHFYQKVKALTNHTPFELLKNYRLEKAARLLVNEKVSVNEAYMRTGFKSRPHFSKLFKQKYSVSPGKYSDTVGKAPEQET